MKNRHHPLGIEASCVKTWFPRVLLGAAMSTPGVRGRWVVAYCSCPGSDLSEEPVFRMLSRSRWTTASFLSVLPGPLRSACGRGAGVGNEVAVDAV